MNLDYFQILKWILQTVRAVKVEEKMGVISLVSMFPSWFMALRWSKKLDFLQICADLSKKPKSVNLHICIWKFSLLSFRKWVIGVWATGNEILAI